MVGKNPIFFDSSGMRWLWTKIAAVTLVAFVAMALVILIPPALKTPKLSGSLSPVIDSSQLVSKSLEQTHESPSYELPTSIAKSIVDKTKLPVVGAGTLVRVVRVESRSEAKYVVEPYSGAITRRLNQAEVEHVGSYQYVIERYADRTADKRIAITFDDGPDPLYTPAILDILAREHVQATFFAIGSSIAKYPDIANRIVAEGHTIGNHTFNHINFNSETSSKYRDVLELNQSQRLIRSVTGYSTAYFRLPYGGNDDVSMRENVLGILEAQRLGYVVVSEDFDTRDWAFPLGVQATYPNLGSDSIVALFHDSGGDRAQTLTYLREFIHKARAQGYQFTSLDNYYGYSKQPLFAPIKKTVADKTTYIAARAFLVWPKSILKGLFVITLASIFIGLMMNAFFATVQTIREKIKHKPQQEFAPFVSILIPAYNEETVIRATVDAIMSAKYYSFEILLINDGSTDNTWQVMQDIAKENTKVVCIDQLNSGKSGALNNGISKAKGDVIVAMDADTLFEPDAIANLARHFADPRVGGVAGVVKVGNIRNLLTRWQALEYMTGINIARTAQALLDAIVIVPGACGAWKKQAIIDAGGYSHDTLAEDCDLTLAVRKAGYKIVQEPHAISHTESPEDMGPLAKQRFRWTFGNSQTFWKHRDMIFNPKYGWLGMLVLPNAVFGILAPIVFMPLTFGITIQAVVNKQYLLLASYSLATSAILLATSLVAVLLAGEKLRHLLIVPVTKILYSPMRTYLLGRSILTALIGAHVGWNKLKRTGNASIGLSSPGQLEFVSATDTSSLQTEAA